MTGHVCETCPSCKYCVTGVPHGMACDLADGGTAPTAGPTPDATPFDGVAVPVAGAYLVIDGVVRLVESRWVELGPTRDGRIRWGVATRSEVDHD